MHCDTLLSNGRIVTGSGNPWYRGDVAIEDGKIVAIGRAVDADADEIVDASGLIVCPGFIDAHSHSDFEYFVDATAQSKVRQGVTLEVVGNCGFSAAPWKGESRRPERTYGYSPSWESMSEYLDAFDLVGKPLNIAPLQGHGSLRAAVVGLANRPPSKRELEEMRRTLVTGLEDGVFGLSLGLYFSPGSYASRDELICMSETVAQYRGVVSCHIRDEGTISVGFVRAVKEFIAIGHDAKVPINISHIKAHGPASWGLSQEVIRILDDARESGVEVTCDQYPYTASGGHIATDTLPLSFQAGKTPTEIASMLAGRGERDALVSSVRENIEKRGGASNQIVSNYPPAPNLEGKAIQEVAEERHTDPALVVLDLLAQAGKECFGIGWVSRAMSEDDVENFLRYPWTMIGSDGAALSSEGPLSPGRPHPRNFGTFPRVLCRYVRERKILRLEEAVRKMTSLPAQTFGICDRGTLGRGKWADIVVFDEEQVNDAPFEMPKQYPKGIQHVMVNGQWVIKNHVFTGTLPGKVLRH